MSSITNLCFSVCYLHCLVTSAQGRIHQKTLCRWVPCPPKTVFMCCLHERCHSWSPAATSSWRTAALGWGGKGRVLQASSRAVLFSATSHVLLPTFADCCWYFHSCSSNSLALLDKDQELTEATKDFLRRPFASQESLDEFTSTFIKICSVFSGGWTRDLLRTLPASFSL